MQILDGKKLSLKILDDIKVSVSKLSFQPIFCDVLVGDDLVSSSYVRMKARVAESVGIKFMSAHFRESITTEELIKEIENLNQVKNMCGIIVQLPLPKHIDKSTVLDAIDANLDVDCLGSVMSKKFYANQALLSYPTALSCMELLKTIDLNDKKIVMLGQGLLVGRPVAHLLESQGYKVSKITKDTNDADILLKNADVIISAIGQGKFIKGEMIKEGVVIIDAGTSEENGGVVGDVDLESVQDIASYLSPVPGGVGPVTVAMLLKNVLIVAQNLK